MFRFIDFLSRIVLVLRSIPYTLSNLSDKFLCLYLGHKWRTISLFTHHTYLECRYCRVRQLLTLEEAKAKGIKC
jgi:hypothetical protein